MGSALAGRSFLARRDPIITFALLEGWIGVYGLASPLLLRFVSAVPSELQFVCALMLLLPATIAMGASLPVLSRAFGRDKAWPATEVGRLYAVNTAGAVLGPLLAVFALFPTVGLTKTLYVAAGADLLVLFGIILARKTLSRSVHRNIRRVATERGSTRPASCRRDGRFGHFRHGLRGRLVSHALSRLWFFDLRRLDHAFHLPSGSCRRLCLGILSVTKTHRASFLPRSELAFDRLVRGCLCQPAGYAQSSLRLPEPLPVRTRKGPHPFRNPVRDCCRPHAPCHAVPGCDASRRGGGAPVVQERSRPPCFLALHGQLGRRRAGGGSCRRGLAGKLRHRAVRARRIPRCADARPSCWQPCRAERVPERR